MGLLISQLGGVLGSSENTKMQAVLRSWVISAKSTKTIMGISPLCTKWKKVLQFH